MFFMFFTNLGKWTTNMEICVARLRVGMVNSKANWKPLRIPNQSSHSYLTGILGLLAPQLCEGDASQLASKFHILPQLYVEYPIKPCGSFSLEGEAECVLVYWDVGPPGLEWQAEWHSVDEDSDLPASRRSQKDEIRRSEFCKKDRLDIRLCDSIYGTGMHI